jgi:DNA-directed RNA polymerase beta subunit
MSVDVDTLIDEAVEYAFPLYETARTRYRDLLGADGLPTPGSFVAPGEVLVGRVTSVVGSSGGALQAPDADEEPDGQ